MSASELHTVLTYQVSRHNYSPRQKINVDMTLTPATIITLLARLTRKHQPIHSPFVFH